MDQADVLAQIAASKIAHRDIRILAMFVPPSERYRESDQDDFCNRYEQMQVAKELTRILADKVSQLCIMGEGAEETLCQINGAYGHRAR